MKSPRSIFLWWYLVTVSLTQRNSYLVFILTPEPWSQALSHMELRPVPPPFFYCICNFVMLTSLCFTALHLLVWFYVTVKEQGKPTPQRHSEGKSLPQPLRDALHSKPPHLSVGLGVRLSGIKPQFQNHRGTALEQWLEQSKPDSGVFLSACPSFPPGAPHSKTPSHFSGIDKDAGNGAGGLPS